MDRELKASGGGFTTSIADKITERLSKYGVGFLEQINEDDYLITDPWIYFSVLIHAYFDSLDGIKWNGFLEEDVDLLEDRKEEAIPLNKHTEKWLSEDRDVVSFRYFKAENDETIYVKFIQITEKTIEMNLISNKKDDEIKTFEISLPENLDLLMDVKALLKTKSIKDQFEKLSGNVI